MDPYTTTQGREACHSARDAFLACADKNIPEGGNLRLALDSAACAEQRARFNSLCLASWRIYWEDRYSRNRPIIGRQQ